MAGYKSWVILPPVLHLAPLPGVGRADRGGRFMETPSTPLVTDREKWVKWGMDFLTFCVNRGRLLDYGRGWSVGYAQEWVCVLSVQEHDITSFATESYAG